MNRKKAIEVLEALSDCNYIGSLSGEDIEALTMAIRCLKVDEAYDLEYEHIPSITITVEEYMHLRECENKWKEQNNG